MKDKPNWKKGDIVVLSNNNGGAIHIFVAEYDPQYCSTIFSSKKDWHYGLRNAIEIRLGRKHIMGMESFAVNSFVIGYDDLKKIVPDQISAIENEKFFKDIGWFHIGRWLAWDDIGHLQDAILVNCYDEDHDEEYNQEVAAETSRSYINHINNLQTSFNEKTGLILYFDSYYEDGGDWYDNPNDKDGCIFCVDGMVQLTPAGEKFKNIITERRWTKYG